MSHERFCCSVSPGSCAYTVRRPGFEELSILGFVAAGAIGLLKLLLKEQVGRIGALLGDRDLVVCGLSGGVDSTVAAALVHRAVGDRQTCIFVDNGLLREGEFESTLSLLRQSMKLNIVGIQAGEKFLTALRGSDRS